MADSPAVTEPTLDALKACAGRELAMRRNVYPKWVASGRLKQAMADKEIAGMEAIVRLLERLADDALRDGLRAERDRLLRALADPPADLVERMAQGIDPSSGGWDVLSDAHPGECGWQLYARRALATFCAWAEGGQ